MGMKISRIAGAAPLARVALASAIFSLVSARALAETSCPSPSWTRVPSADDMIAAYPAKARKDGVKGLAILQCAAQADGSLAGCVVESEDPAQYEFGAAALKLAGLIRTTPPCSEAQAHGVRIPIRFALPAEAADERHREAVYKIPERRFRKFAPAGPYWPDRALLLDQGGHVTIQCQVAADLKLKACRLVWDTAPSLGFGDAVLRMAARGWMTAAPLPPGASEQAELWWTFEVDFAARSLADEDDWPGGPPRVIPVEPPDRQVLYKTTHAVAGLGPPGGYYPDAAARAGVPGAAVVDCRVNDDGALNDCTVFSAFPVGWGFDDSALRMAKDHYISAAPLPDGQSPAHARARLTIVYPKPQ
ncbi:MAG: TonB family protein [Phenylobacterium sp.]|nr:MAG: TonB family protein [Phenylobacterium sp.]